MKTVTVNVSKTYPVHIGGGLLQNLGQEVLRLGKARKVCLVSDTQVFPLYGEGARKSLEDAGLETVCYVFPAGEESKNGENFLALLNFLAESGLTRSDVLVALGGGVVGDLAGFAAACYLRGIRFIQAAAQRIAVLHFAGDEYGFFSIFVLPDKSNFILLVFHLGDLTRL